MEEISKTQNDQELIRHSMAHILAMAIMRLYPNTKIGIGPAIENGFYYEVDTPVKITYKDLPKIEAEMNNIISEELQFKQIIIPKEQAFDTLMQSGQIYKTELLKQIPDESVSFYKTGEFFDLCRGPHIKHTGLASFFKLTKISSSNWLGEKNRPKLQRIEGVAFLNKEDLDAYLASQKEIIQRDYKKIGRKLNLITFDEDIGDNLLIWLPKGNVVKERLKEFVFSKFEEIETIFLSTPNIAKFTLYRDYFETAKSKDTYLPTVKTTNNEYLIRNDCFYHHSRVFRSTKKSYRQLPIRYTEFYNVLGQIVNTDTTNSDLSFFQRLQTNIFARNDQLQDELEKCFSIILDLFQYLKIDSFQIQAKQPNSKDKNNKNKEAKGVLKLIEKALAKKKLSAKLIQNDFYNDGIELQFLVKDISGNPHIISTIKLDICSAEKEELYYVNKNNLKETPAVVRFNAIESFETLFKIILENNQGVFDVWLSPVQCIVIAISEKYHEKANEILTQLKKEGIRTEKNFEADTMQNKIRRAENENIPYMLIIGEKELNTNSVSLRQRNGQELGLIRIEEFIDRIHREIDQKGF